MPFCLVSLFMTNAFILDHVAYKVLFSVQCVFYFLAALGIVIKRSSRLTDVPAMFCIMNMAAVAGLYRFLTQRQDVKWERTA